MGFGRAGGSGGFNTGCSGGFPGGSGAFQGVLGGSSGVPGGSRGVPGDFGWVPDFTDTHKRPIKAIKPFVLSMCSRSDSF